MPLLALLLAGAVPPADHPRHYLLSVAGLPLKAKDRVESFAFDTWGVQFDTVCHIPPGWRITAGGSAAPDGILKGEGSHGVTWLTGPNPPELRDVVLVTLYDRVQPHDVKSGTGVVPATFKGTVTTWDYARERKLRLTSANIRLRPATRCQALPLPATTR